MPHRRHPNWLTALAREIDATRFQDLPRDIRLRGSGKDVELRRATNDDQVDLQRYAIEMTELDPHFRRKRLIDPRVDDGSFAGSTVQPGEGIIALDPASDKIVGEAFFVRCPCPGGLTIASLELSVHPNLRGQGVGTELIEALVRYAREQRIRRLVARVRAADHAVTAWARRRQLVGEHIGDGILRFEIEL